LALYGKNVRKYISEIQSIRLSVSLDRGEKINYYIKRKIYKWVTYMFFCPYTLIQNWTWFWY